MGGPAGSGISYGRPHPTRHVDLAVSAAMERAGLDHVMGVLLFLTEDHLRTLQPALRTAARVARCTQVFGCSAMGVFTDEDWIVDSYGAAALVFGDGVAIGPVGDEPIGGPVISLATPEAVSLEWLERAPRLGAIASDSGGRGPFQVWSHGRPDPAGAAGFSLAGVEIDTAVAKGVRPLTAPMEVAEARGVDLVKLGKYPALNVLINALPPSIREMERIPLHMLMCGITFGDPDTAIEEGRYHLDHIVAANAEDHSVTLADELHEGQRLFWALRDRLAAEQDMRHILQRTLAASSGTPDFGLMFSCLGRGPGLYGGTDRDIELLREECPGMPFVGFYGNGEIAPGGNGSRLHSYSAAVGLCRRTA